MSPEDKVIYLDAAKNAVRGAISGAYDQLRQLAMKRLAALFSNMLDHADDALFERAEKAETNQEQSSYFSAMRLVRLRRRELEEGFQRELMAGFRALTSSTEARRVVRETRLDESDLSLVDNEALEQSIAIDSMTAKARARNALALSHLTMRLDHLLPQREVNEHNNPLDPRQVTRAFAAAADVLELEIAPRLVIFKLFDKFVMSQLGGLYDEANRTLIELGILPTLKGTVGGRRSEAAPSAGAPQAQAEAASVVADPSAGDGAAVVQMLHQLLANQKYGGTPPPPQWTGVGYAPTAGYGAGASPATVADVVAALSALQRDDSGPALGEADFKALLGRIMVRQAGQPKALARGEDDTIDIVGMLFEAILNDPRLPASIKALIGRLQIPVLKVALLDHSFFASARHPARQLINEMAHASLGWVEPADVSRDPLYRQIETIVERVLSDFDQDIGLFQELLLDFQRFLEEERERVRLIEERTRQAAEGKAKVDDAKARVDAEIRRRTAGRVLPPVVRTLLDEAWSKVLFINYLKEGEEGESWQRQLNVVDRLLWSVEPKASVLERKQLLAEIPALLQDLRAGLNAILFNPFEMTKLFKALEKEHIRCLAASGSAAAAERNDQPSEPEETAYPPAEASSPLAVAEPPAAAASAAPPFDAAAPAEAAGEEIDEELDQALQTLREVPIGTWFEFSLVSGGTMRAKLSARLAGGRRLIFVNRAGFKMADKTLLDTARALREGKAQILDDNLLFDKALETVICNLRDLRAGQ